MSDAPNPVAPTIPDESQTGDHDEDDVAVSTIPLDTEDGGTTVISQQNVGPDNQVGGGEFKNVTGEKTVDDAASEQDQLESDRPIGSWPASR